jgi:O-antigen ligase
VAFTVILLLSPQIWLPILGTMRIALLTASLAIGIHLLRRVTQQDREMPLPQEIVIAMVLVAWSVLTLPLSYWPAGSLKTLTEHYLKAVAFFWLIATLVTSTDRLRVFTWALVLCSIPLATTAVYNYVSGVFLYTGVPGLHRIDGYRGGSGLAENPNDLALILNLTIPLAAASAMNARRPLARAVAVVTVALAASAVIVTFSRAGFLTLGAIFIVSLLMLAARKAPGRAVVLLAAGLALLPFLPTGYTQRLSTIADINADQTGSATGRWRDTQAAVGLVVRNPIVGAGIGQDILAMNETRGADWTAVHNAFLQYGVDLGVPGLLLFAWLYLSCVKSARLVARRTAGDRSRRELGNLAVGVLVSLLAFGVAALFHPIAYQFYFFSIGGLAVAVRQAYWRERADG